MKGPVSNWQKWPYIRLAMILRREKQLPMAASRNGSCLDLLVATVQTIFILPSQLS